MKRIIRAATEVMESQDVKEALISAIQHYKESLLFETQYVIDEELDRLIERCKAQGIKVKFLQDLPDIKSNCMSIVTELIDKYSKKLTKSPQMTQEYYLRLLSGYKLHDVSENTATRGLRLHKDLVYFSYNKYELNANIDMRGILDASIEYYYTIWDADDGVVQTKIRVADYLAGKYTVFSNIIYHR